MAKKIKHFKVKCFPLTKIFVIAAMWLKKVTSLDQNYSFVKTWEKTVPHFSFWKPIFHMPSFVPGCLICLKCISRKILLLLEL